VNPTPRRGILDFRFSILDFRLQSAIGNRQSAIPGSHAHGLSGLAAIIVVLFSFLLRPGMAAEPAGKPQEPPGEAEPAPPPPAPPANAEGATVNMEFRDTDLPTVLRAICQGAKLDFVLDPKVTGKVTAKLRNTTWETALEIVLKSQGLAAARQGDTLVIGPPAPEGRPDAAAAARQGPVAVTARPDGKVDFDAGGADIREAVRELARVAKMNIAASKDVSGTVTASLHDLKPEEILLILAGSCGASVAERDHVMLLVPRLAEPAPPGAHASVGSPPTALAQPEAPKAAKAIEVKRLPSGKLAVRATEATLPDFLAQLGTASGLNIVAAPGLRGTITLNLEGVEPQDVLAAVGAHSNLAFKPMGAILYAAPLPPTTRAETFRLRHAKAEELVKILSTCAEGAKVAADPTNNVVVIVGSPELIAIARAVIENVEKAPIQVNIEARILETNLTGEKWLGIEWSDVFTIRNSFPQVPNTFPFSADSSSSFNPGYDPSDSRARGDKTVPYADTGDFKFGILTATALQMVLHTLKTDTCTRMLANPTVTTVENREASIKIVGKFPFPQYQVSTQTGVLSLSGFDYKEFGTTLTVKPQVQDGRVFLDVHPEVSRMSGTTTFQGVNVPVIQSQEAKTQVWIQDGDTLVIAGLIREDTEKTTTELPGFSKIPFFGALFRSKHDTTDSRRNLVIFITPHIVADEDFARAAELKKKHTEPLPTLDEASAPGDRRAPTVLPRGEKKEK